MDQDRINKDRLLDKIVHSRELTALEKRYLEDLVMGSQPVKRGKWEVKGGVHCTRCGWMPSGRICDLFTNFCAGCGADMRGDTDVAESGS